MVPHQVAPRFVPFDTFKKERDINLKRLCDVPQTRCAYAVCARFIFLDLLKFNSNLIRKLLLGHPNQPSAMSNAFSHVLIDGMCHVVFLCLSMPFYP